MSSPVDPKLTRKVARKLSSALNARYREVTDDRLDRVYIWAVRSERNADATFAAVQMLRDLEAIDRAEAAYLFDRLFSYLLDKDWGESDPALEQAVRDNVEHELIMAAMTDRERARADAFHRDHGEPELADLLLHNEEAYSSLRADGAMSLIEDKPSSKRATDPAAEPEKTAGASHALAECVLALSATETIREWLPAWYALTTALRAVDPPAAVAAVQGLRDIRAISFNESLVLIDMAIDRLVSHALAGDREHHRLQRALEECARKFGIDEADGAADETRPIEWQVLKHRWVRRFDGITAVVLRRFGEHRLANLLMTAPEEYAEIRNQMAVGVRRIAE